MQYKHSLLLALSLCLPCGVAQAQVIESLDVPIIPVGIAPFSTLGWDISVHGDAMVASNPGHDQGLAGEVWSFWRVSGIWQIGTRVQHSNAQAGDNFGKSLDCDDQTLVISASKHPLGPRLYVFERSGNDWVETAILDHPGATQFFGNELSFEGDRIVTADLAAGETYIFERALGVWSLAHTLVGVTGPLAVDGDTLAAVEVGTRVAVFEKALGVWTKVAGFDFGNFLVQPALEQDLLVVPFAGLLHVHERINGTWVSTAQLKSAIQFSFGGYSVALHGDRIVAVSSSPLPGVKPWVSFWIRETASSNLGTEWSERKLYQVNGATKSVLRLEVDFDGDTIAVGDWAFNTTGPTLPSTGAVYIADAPQTADFFGDSFCHGDTGLCPCGFQTFWPGGPGCQGSTYGALLLGSGSNSVAANGLVMSAFGLPKNVPALLIWSKQSSSTPTPFGNGLMCLTGSIQRTTTLFSNSIGSAEWTNGPAAFGPAGSISGGDELRFQVWYRDPTAVCGQGFNLTNGFKVRLTL